LKAAEDVRRRPNIVPGRLHSAIIAKPGLRGVLSYVICD
jgi:hypothetical protein